MKISSNYRQTLSRTAALAALSALVVVAGCGAPPAPPTPTLPPGTVDIAQVPLLRWVKGEPVDLRLGALGIGTRVVFELSGTLPLGVHLQADGRLAGLPERSGTWRAGVLATGSSGSKTGAVGGYVVEQGLVGSAPTLANNPLRAPFMLPSTSSDGLSRTYPIYRPGSTSPEAAPVLGGNANLPADPEEQKYPESFLLPTFRAQRSLDNLPGGSECIAELRDFWGTPIRTIVLDPDPSCDVTSMLSSDGSTFVLRSPSNNGDGTWTHRFWFIRSRDGEILRAASSVGPSESPQLILSQDGALLGVEGAQPNQLRVIGVRPAGDKLITFDDASDRVCVARGTQVDGGTSPTTTALGSAMLACETPHVSFQAGTVNLASGQVWLSSPILIPDFATTFRYRGFMPLALSPAGDQIVVGWSEIEFIPPCGIFGCSETRTNFDELAVMNVDDSDQTLRKIVDTPSEFRGFFGFVNA